MGRQAASGFLRFLTAAAAAMLLAACRDASGTVDPSARFSPDAEAKAVTLGLYADGARVGDFHYSRREGRWNGADAVELSEEVSLRLSFRGDGFEIYTRSRAYLSTDLAFLGSISAVDFGGGLWETRWERKEGRSYRRSEILGGRSRTEEDKVLPGLPAAESLPLLLEAMAAKGETVRSLEVYNLDLGRTIPVRLSYNGESDGLKHFTMSMWGMTEQIWTDGDGLPARETLSLAGLEARPAEGKEQLGNLPLERVLSQTALPAEGVPDDLGSRPQAVLLLQGAPAQPPSTTWQEVSAEGKDIRVAVRMPEVPEAGSRSTEGAGALDGFALDLDSERIRDLAASITAGMDDPWDKAAAVNRWVHDNLRKSMRESLSALQALRAGEGECQSHSLLAVALCRAAGVPARFVYGAVYLRDQKAFLYHTWVEVWMGRWIPIDPTLGSIPAGPDHLTLAFGGYRDQFQVFPYILAQSGWRVVYVQGQNPGARSQEERDRD